MSTHTERNPAIDALRQDGKLPGRILVAETAWRREAASPLHFVLLDYGDRDRTLADTFYRHDAIAVAYSIAATLASHGHFAIVGLEATNVDDELTARCNTCDRVTAASHTFGKTCGMRRPGGAPCLGTLEPQQPTCSPTRDRTEPNIPDADAWLRDEDDDVALPRYFHADGVIGGVQDDGDLTALGADACTFVGRHGDYDLFVHLRHVDGDGHVETIARYGPGESDCFSGPRAAQMVTDLIGAARPA